jgi:hypothetical protein
MTPSEAKAIVKRHLSGELSQDEAAALLLVGEPVGGFNLTFMVLSESDRQRVFDLFHAALILSAERGEGAP